jgi:hypothetical protein
MLRILHISDPHAQTETMRRLNSLALAESTCEVVALTGDVVNNSCDKLPTHWDSWPQRVKLSAPGNHDDHSRPFQHLRKWEHLVPWGCSVQDLLFVGLGLKPALWPENLAAGLRAARQRQADRKDSRGVVLLTHYNPLSQGGRRFCDVLSEFVDGRELLILHGHNHPSTFPGSFWNHSEELLGKRIFRSHVCSSSNRSRGLGHRITWDGVTFTSCKVQG